MGKRISRNESSRLRRAIGASAIVIALAAPWLGLVLLSRDVLPGGEAWILPLLGVSLIATYVGGWLFVWFISRARRLTLMRAVATTLTVTAILLILELPAALHGVHWTLIFRYLSGEGFDYTSAYVLDEELSFRRIPGFRWSGRPRSDIEEAYGLPRSISDPITFTYDRWGYRNATDIERAEVVLLGDSFVESWYVSDEQTVAAQLEARLDAPVANLAVAGYGTMQALRVLEGDALLRQPRIAAWFFFEGNDLYDDEKFENALLAEPPSSAETTSYSQGLTRHHGWSRRSFVLNAFRSLRRWAHPVIPNRAPYWAYLPDENGGEPVYFFGYGSVPWTDFEEGQWVKARDTFQRGIEWARERNIHLAFLLVPTKYRVYRDFIDIPEGSPLETWSAWEELPAHFRQFCAMTSAACLDLTGPLKQSVQEGRMPFAPTDTHWNPDGHAVAAAELAWLIRERGW